jgi:hypothetical protein
MCDHYREMQPNPINPPLNTAVSKMLSCATCNAQNEWPGRANSITIDEPKNSQSIFFIPHQKLNASILQESNSGDTDNDSSELAAKGLEAVSSVGDLERSRGSGSVGLASGLDLSIRDLGDDRCGGLAGLNLSVRDLGDRCLGGRGSLDLSIRNLRDRSRWLGGSSGSLNLSVTDLGDRSGGGCLDLSVRDLRDGSGGDLDLAIGDLRDRDGGRSLGLSVGDLGNWLRSDRGTSGLTISLLADYSNRGASWLSITALTDDGTRGAGAARGDAEQDGLALSSPVAVIQVVEATA